MRDKDAAFHPSSQALSLSCSFPFSWERGWALNFQPKKLMKMEGGGGGEGRGCWLASKGVSSQVGPFLNFPPPIFSSTNWVDG